MTKEIKLSRQKQLFKKILLINGFPGCGKTMLSPILSSFVALSELSAGFMIIIGGFIKNPYGNILTRFAGFVIIIMMVNIFAIAHKDWFITTKLFTSEQIFLLIGGIYFLIKGNKS